MDDVLPTLSCEAVQLRPPKMEDADRLFAEMEHPDVRSRLAFAHRFSDAEQLRSFLAKCDEFRCCDKWYVFVVADIKTDDPIGMTWFAQIVEHTRAEMGTWLARHTWGGGLYREVKGLIMPFGFDYLRLRRIEGRIAVSNVRMQKAFESVGAVREGVIREGLLLGEQAEDQYLYSVLASEYRPKR